MIFPLTLSAISRFHFALHSSQSVSNAGLSWCAMISLFVFIFICIALFPFLSLYALCFLSRELNLTAIRIFARISVMFTMWHWQTLEANTSYINQRQTTQCFNSGFMPFNFWTWSQFFVLYIQKCYKTFWTIMEKAYCVSSSTHPLCQPQTVKYIHEYCWEILFACHL